MCTVHPSSCAFVFPNELFVSFFLHGYSYVDIGCKKLTNLVVHTTVLFQSASNSDTDVNHEENKVA